ncbi:lipoprotein [Sporosarcina cyprini]|uniref:lipoprotein n=1 Tax=Sporosarcina cyprini TaxID=2910523 RepID=UPI001EDED89C|nr:membrane lipoprotein lipid attachment site-containing protein [Sporosarcina cyprini]MCG3088937.1 membrane lipoprotein lipid attachment site-containing protein [Sporosarcina cyprini]
MKKYFIFISLLLTVSACSSAENIASNELEGIELELSINKLEYSPNDEIIATVKLTNHNDSPRTVYAPIPADAEEGISAVMAWKKGENQWQFLSPQNNQDISNIKERSFYDYVLVELDADETIEQEFSWNRELFNEENDENFKADSGEYMLSTFVVLDEIKTQEEYFEPKKQVISKINIKLK